MKPIPYAKQFISPEDIQAVVDVLRSDFLTQGPAILNFEKAVAKFCEAKHAVAISNATAALHLACLAVGLKPGEWLWTVPNTFVASANCALYCGAKVDFVDIDPATYNISIDALKAKLASAEREGKLPRVLVPVHFSGQSCEMAEIAELAEKYGFAVIEDASHAIGGEYKNRKVGSCAYSDMTILSFHPVKIITTGEGGMVLTNNAEYADRISRLRTHGITRDPNLMTHPAEGPWYYQQIELGFNYRMTDIQAALGHSQLKNLNAFIDRRRQLAERYFEKLEHLPLRLPWRHPDSLSAFHLFVVRLKLDQISKTQSQVFKDLHRAGVLVNLHYIPVHLQPYYMAMGFHKGQFAEAEKYYSEAMSLPMYVGLTEEEQDEVVSRLSEVLK
ncbi:MAG: UDP-4-amino-4,6-dideoxy-N-acetyl-beta-L-altrosamine transaminase [Bdellovibrionota bacterium]